MRLPLGRVPRAFTRRGLNVRAWTWTTPVARSHTRGRRREHRSPDTRVARAPLAKARGPLTLQPHSLDSHDSEDIIFQILTVRYAHPTSRTAHAFGSQVRRTTRRDVHRDRLHRRAFNPGRRPRASLVITVLSSASRDRDLSTPNNARDDMARRLLSQSRNARGIIVIIEQDVPHGRCRAPRAARGLRRRHHRRHEGCRVRARARIPHAR